MWVIYFAFIIFSSELEAVSIDIDLGIHTGDLPYIDTDSIDARRLIMNVPQIVNDMIEKVKQFTMVRTQEYQSNLTAFREEASKKHLRIGRENHGRHGRPKHGDSKKKEKDVLRQRYVHTYQIKNDSEITNFTKHIYKQAMKIFDKLKDWAQQEPKLMREIEDLTRIYDDKFGDFVKRTQHHNIKTRLGRQKVIVNTLETSNGILNRLVNFMTGRIKKTGHNLRNKLPGNYLNRIKKKMEIENQHICQQFGICRSGTGFSTFLTDVLTTILSSNDKQIKVMADALTEALKYTRFTKVMDPVTARGFKDTIVKFESFDPFVFKAVFQILKNIIVSKNKPIEVIGAEDKRINKTVAFLELLDAFETAMPPNEQNILEWEEIVTSIKDWRDDKRNDITEIMQIFVDHLEKASEKFDAQTALNAQHDLVVILDYPDQD